MARNRVGVKGRNQRKIEPREHDSEESDEEYKVTEDEDIDDSDECYSIGSDESEDILADFEDSRRVSRSRKTRRTSSGRRENETIKPRKRRRVSYAEDDDYDDDDDDSVEFVSLRREANWKKPMEKKKVSYTEMDECDDEEDYAEFAPLGTKRNQRKTRQEKKRVVYTEDDESEGEGEDDDDDDDNDDQPGEFMSSGREFNHIKEPEEKKRVSDTEFDDNDADYSEFMSSGRKRNHRKKTREKKGVVYTEDDESAGENDDDFDDDDAEFVPVGREANRIKKPMEKKKVSYTEMDEYDDDEDPTESLSLGTNRNQRTKPQEKRRVVYTEDDESEGGDDDGHGGFMSSGREFNLIKNPTEKKRLSDTEFDGNDDEDYAEFLSSDRKRNQRKKPHEKKVVYTEEDEDEDDDDDKGEEQEDDDDEFMYSGRKVNQKKNLREKRKVSYTEDDDEEEEEEKEDIDFGFLCTSRKGNQIKASREKSTVSYKEDDQEEEEEDEKDAEFKLSDSDLFDDDDDDDTTPKMKKNEKVSWCNPQKKVVLERRKTTKKSNTIKPTRLDQRNYRLGRKLGSSKEKSVKNKTEVGNRRKKTTKIRKQRATADSDSGFDNSAESDHEYTISEEEREQMREARVYCANLRAKLRSSPLIIPEQSPNEQRKYPVRKGKEKIEDSNDEAGKQVCGICLSEEGKRTVRGVLNCCRHYFCFSCIMEWSKVESRCPVCKQRFTTITKAAKSDTGFDLRTVVIPVPECDQVYQPSEEELRGYLDPYESVICTECHNGGEDALMLLCDICDSPAHSFCVGLGREVPEGNWYCEGCKPTVFGSLNSQRPTPTSDRRISSNASDLSSPIAGGFDLNELYVPETPLTQQTRAVPEPMPAPTGTVATTLRDRRRIHRQMHHNRLLNNNRMTDFGARSSGTSGSSSGIRLFGSQLDQAGVSTSQNDHIFSPRSGQFGIEVQDSTFGTVDLSLPDEHVISSFGSGSGMGFDSRLGFAQLHPCTNRSSMGTDTCPSPYACREVIGSSRASSQGGFHTPFR